MVQAKIKLARDEGKWPGWNKKKDENGELVEDENASAKKLFSQTGSCINWTAHDKAETALGLHLLDNCTWFLPLFDCYQQVCRIANALKGLPMLYNGFAICITFSNVLKCLQAFENIV